MVSVTRPPRRRSRSGLAPPPDPGERPSGGLAALDPLGDDPLLGDGQQIVDEPVQHEPDGKNRKNPVKTMGRNIITFAWMGSGGVGLSRCCRNIDPP